MKLKIDKTWILVADAARARIFMANGRTQPLKTVAELESPWSLARNQDLVTDRPGRFFSPAVGGPRHAVGPRSDPHMEQKTAFARDLARRIDEAARAKTFDKLVLVAPPAMLGDLRKAMNDAARKKIKAEVAKDLTRVPRHEIAGHLGDALH